VSKLKDRVAPLRVALSIEEEECALDARLMDVDSVVTWLAQEPEEPAPSTSRQVLRETGRRQREGRAG